MADTQASAFGDIPALDLTNDRIPILDVSATGNDKNKLISPTNLMVSKLDLAGGTMTGAVVSSHSSLGATPEAKLSLINITPAAVGAQQSSPGLVFTGHGWKTTATAASQQVDFRVSSSPLQAATAPIGRLAIASQINGGGWADQLYVRSDGWITGNADNTIGVRINTQGLMVGFSNSGISSWSTTVQLTHLAVYTNLIGDYAVADTQVHLRDGGAGIVSFKNSTTPHKLRVYGTTTGSKYLQIEHLGDTGAATGIISTSAGGLVVAAAGTNLGFYGATPVARQTTGVAGGAFSAGAGVGVTDADTFSGYTIGQIAQALINVGILT